MRLVLISLAVAPFLAQLGGPGAGRRMVVVPNAADGLVDRDDIVAALVAPVRADGWVPEVVDLASADGSAAWARAFDGAGAIAVGGGDPFRLARMLRGSGVADDLVSRVRRGLPYLGLSAGAMVVAPDLAPLRLTSPFADDAGDGPLPGLALTDRLVLPHHDRDGRRARHEAAAVAHPEAHLVPLTDNEALVVDDEVAVVWSVDGTGRDAEPRRTI